MKIVSSILLFLINSSFQTCDQRGKLKNQEFVETLFVFIAPSESKNNRYQDDDMKKIKILYEEVMCAIPEYEKFKYMTVINENNIQRNEIRPKFELAKDWNSARNTISSSYSPEEDACTSFTIILNDVMKMKPNYTHIEVIYNVPKFGSVTKCPYSFFLKYSRINGHVNFIRYDSIEYFGYNSLNLPDISLNIQEVKELARNFVDSILDIKSESVNQKNCCDYSWKIFGFIVIGTIIGLISGIGLAIAIACIIKKVTKRKSEGKLRLVENVENPGILKPVENPKILTKQTEVNTGTESGSRSVETAGKTGNLKKLIEISKPAKKDENSKISTKQTLNTETEGKTTNASVSNQGSTIRSTSRSNLHSQKQPNIEGKRKKSDFEEDTI
ncbi:unnamed protein product [Caenorhabditis angaria]|uniref:Receptor L-domain domain-containing protein n=1 Tax=Caenorhabditis angaria TaxID=860376 RepID=A0A9P1IMN7_9PELO|nr:unnamed protein product [Caenorhabditis angaria]